MKSAPSRRLSVIAGPPRARSRLFRDCRAPCNRLHPAFSGGNRKPHPPLSLAESRGFLYLPAMTETAASAPAESILIIDFGSQVTQLIARRLRETGVYCEIHPFQSAMAAFE